MEYVLQVPYHTLRCTPVSGTRLARPPTIPCVAHLGPPGPACLQYRTPCPSWCPSPLPYRTPCPSWCPSPLPYLTVSFMVAFAPTTPCFAHLRPLLANWRVQARRLCPPIFPNSLPHFRLFEVVSLHRCVHPYKHRKILDMLLKLMKSCGMLWCRPLSINGKGTVFRAIMFIHNFAMGCFAAYVLKGMVKKHLLFRRLRL